MSSGEFADPQMNLAQADGGGGGGGGAGGSGNLASSAGDKKRAASFMEKHLLPDTQAAGRMADGGGSVRPPLMGPTAPGATPGIGVLKPDTGLEKLSGWATEAGLSEAMPVWQSQVGRLMGKLQGELKALRGTNTLFQGQDLSTGSQFGPTGQPPLYPSRLNRM